MSADIFYGSIRGPQVSEEAGSCKTSTRKTHKFQTQPKYYQSQLTNKKGMTYIYGYEELITKGDIFKE